MCVWYLCAVSRPLSPSSSSSLTVEGIEGSNAFRSTTPSPSPCSTPTLTPPASPWRWNCTRRMAAPDRPRRCGSVVRLSESKVLRKKNERRGSLIWRERRQETDKQRGKQKSNKQQISFLSACFYFSFIVRRSHMILHMTETKLHMHYNYFFFSFCYMSD